MKNKTLMSRILPPVPDGVNCHGLLFVGRGNKRNFGKKGLDCLQNIYHGETPSKDGQRCGSGRDRLYAIDLNCPIEEVNEALIRFEFVTLDRLYYDIESLPESGLVHVLNESGNQHLLDCEYGTGPYLLIGWRPQGGIKADRTEVKI